LIQKNYRLVFRLVSLVLFLMLATKLKSQQDLRNNASLEWFDQQVGLENTVLYDGIIYKETYRTINDKIKFYKSSSWLNGSLMYNGQMFTEIPMRYDVFGDQLLIKLKDQLGGGALLLFKNKVSTFTIDNTVFVNVKEIAEASGSDGFYELLWENGDMRLLAKHQKNDFLRKDRRSIYYEFIDDKKLFLLQYDGKYTPIGRKKDITALFPEFKKEVDDFYQKNKRLRSRDMDGFMGALINQIEDLLLQNQAKSPS